MTRWPRIKRHQVRRAAGELSIGGLWAVVAVFLWGLTVGELPVELAIIAGALLLGGCTISDQAWRALGLGLVLGMVTPGMGGLLLVQLGGAMALANLVAGNAERFAAGHALHGATLGLGFLLTTMLLRVADAIPVGAWLLPQLLSIAVAPLLVLIVPVLRRKLRAVLPARPMPRAHELA